MDKSVEKTLDELLDGSGEEKKHPKVSEIIASGSKTGRERLEIVYANLKVVGRTILLGEIIDSPVLWDEESAKDLARGLVEIAFLINETVAQEAVDNLNNEMASYGH